LDLSSTGLWGVFIIVLLAELGDKTQLGVLTLAIKTQDIYKTIISSIMGLVVATMVSVFIGYTLGLILPETIIFFVSGILFLCLGIHELVGREPEHENIAVRGFLTIFLLELGDKTQLAIIMCTMIINNPIVVFIISILAFLVVTAITASLGVKASEKIPQHRIKIASALLFIAIGVILLLICTMGLSNNQTLV